MSGGGVFMRVSIGRPGASAANMRYITRPHSVERDGHELRTRHLPDHADGGRTFAERRATLIAYAEQREEDERDGGLRRGRPRTHYRLVLSCERRIGNERMHGLVDRYLALQFPLARGVSVIHQDTGHTHAHVWLDARGADGRKLHFDTRTYRRLDEAWARVYGREFGLE